MRNKQNSFIAGVVISYLFIFTLITSFTSQAGTITYQYDNLNRLTRVDYPNGNFIEYTYDATGNILNINSYGTTEDYTIDTPAEIITQLYVGYFNRAPDCPGLTYWINTYTGGRKFAYIVYDFAASQEAVSLYPYLGNTSAYSPRNFITAIYNNLFDRDPEADGLQYWLNQLQSGALLAPEMVYAIIEGAKAPTGSAQDKATLEQKVHDALEESGCI